MHVPWPNSVTVAVDTVQTDGVLEVKLTARPEDAVALTINGAVPNAWFERAPNVMVCTSGVTVKLWVTCGAAA
jgi:hypothetical protein